MLPIDIAAAVFARIQQRIRRAPKPQAIEPIVWATIMIRIDGLDGLLRGQKHISTSAILQGLDDIDRAIDHRLNEFKKC